MKRQEELFLKKVGDEYVSFMRETKVLINEAKRATVLALQKALNLQNGDQILIERDGSIKIESKEEKQMP